MDEIPSPGTIPRFEIAAWRERFGVVAGITGRAFDLGLWSDAPIGETLGRWREFRRAETGMDLVVLGHQVHGTEVSEVGAGRGWLQVEGVDGWVTTAPGVLLTVTVADCIPVYLIVPGRGIGVLHAGWRGTAGGILEQGLARLLAATGAPVTDVVMHCGVGICGNCYEVGSAVMAGCGLPADGAGPWHLDLRGHLMERARRLGVSALSASTWCSAHHRDRFYSHRASGGRDGRMVSYLGMLHR